MVFRNTFYNLNHLAPQLTEQTPGVALPTKRLEGTVNLLAEGVEHPLLIVKDRAINLSTISLRNRIFGDIRQKRTTCDRLITGLKDIAQDPPYHPILKLGETASLCLSFFPPEVLEDRPEVVARHALTEKITRIIQRGYKTDYKPNIFWAGDEAELRDKLVEHTQKKGNNIHYFSNISEVKDCLFSNVLKTCLVHPQFTGSLEGRGADQGLILRAFERILHEITHGLVYELQSNSNGLSFPLEEYIVSMAAHQLTADFANEIAGEDIDPEQYKDFLVNGKVSFLSPSHEKRKTILFVTDTMKYHKQIARYFMSKLNSREGLNELNILGE